MLRWLPILLVTIVHLALAWPGAGRRGVISEEIQPYLRHHPRVIEEGEGARLAAPYDDSALAAAVDEGRPVTPRWVGTSQWPELAWHGPTRIVPVLVRGHQTAIGAIPGLALGPVLGEGVAGVRRSSVLVGLGLVGLAALLARRLGASRRATVLVALGCTLSPGLFFFSRTGYGFELASRVSLLATLLVVAPRTPLRAGRAAAAGGLFALAVLCRATIAVTLLPPLLLVLAHPARRATVRGGLARAAIVLGVAVVTPVLVYLALRAWLPLRAAPGADLPLAALGARTAVIPAVLAAQLAWIVDPRGVLGPLLGGLAPSPVPAWAIGGVVAVAALARWHRGVAREPERLFLAALLGNAVGGAYLYGDPGQFQLGMALEPLFVLAVVAQLGAASHRARNPVWLVGAGLLCARVGTLVTLLHAEARTDNPMLSGVAQRALVRALDDDGARPTTTLTTTYDQVGVVEAWTAERHRPLHGWKALKASGVDDAVVEARWRAVLAAHPICHVVLGRAPNPFEGPFTDRAPGGPRPRARRDRGRAHAHPDPRRGRRGRRGVRARAALGVRSMSEPGRASLYATLAAFAGVVALAHGVSAVAGKRARAPVASVVGPADAGPTAPDSVVAYLGPLAAGATFAEHRVARVDPLRDGQLSLEIVGPRGRYVVDLRAKDAAAPPGLASTKAVAVYLRGSGATGADALAACVALADALAARETAGARPPPLTPLGR